MPLKECKQDGKDGFKWGDSGKCFVGADAKERAMEQGKAIEANKRFEIKKLDADQNLVFGWANVSIRKDGEQVVDSHNEMIDPEDLEEAAYFFNLEFRESGVMHKGESVGQLIESFMVTPEKLEAMGLEKSALPVGLWVGFYIESDDVFKRVQSGELKAFSIQGKAVREET